MRGLACGAPPLVAFDGLRYRPVGWGEDPGIFLVVPQVAQYQGLSLEAATDTFFISTIVLASLIGYLGFLLQARTLLGRCVGGAAFFLVTILALRKGDGYGLGAAAALACVPWILLLATRKKLTAWMLVVALLIGTLAQTANYMRSHSGTGITLFAIMILLCVCQAPRSSRALLVLALCLGMCAPILLMRHLFAQRDAFLQAHPVDVYTQGGPHPFWHNVYIGLAYVKNPEIAAYKDEISAARVRELRPNAPYLSPEYEQVLKHEIWELTKRRPLLILENVVVKLIVVCFVCVWAINVGLYATWLAPKPFALEVAFWLLLGFYAIPGVIVVPAVVYLLSLIACAAIYGAYSVEYAARNPAVKWRPHWLARLAAVRSESN